MGMKNRFENEQENTLDVFTPDKFDKLIRGKSINFLIGAGASTPMYPTLSFGEGYPTFEDLISHKDLEHYTRIFMYTYYFKKWIKPMGLDRTNFYEKYGKCKTLESYRRFISLLYSFLLNESNELPKRINIFTTNYDLVFERIFDEFLIERPLIYFNDGSRGFFKKYISNKNFYMNVTHSGYNDNFRREVPTINLFKLHGSMSWTVDEDISKQDRIFVEENNQYLKDLKNSVKDINISLEDIEQTVNNCLSQDIDLLVSNLNKLVGQLNLTNESLERFYEDYSNLSIINPDKYKFSKTVLEQHYYQLIRSFSYELEKKNSILIVFGFSFADEHIKDVFERSLLNPDLLVFVISFSASGQIELKEKFKGYNNIIFLPENFSEYQGDFEYLLYLLGDNDEK
ncbi:SIR2 family protein [Facklamia miroungae]|uniref:SIR2-like domain-containing protein n=1 Tax=Facklamia miroungae TaxID=120956 RepID=A0A1G7UVA3_9LACT|nr:SIR2 family protein [Facklamia miroungae]NKZ30129.1 hypothetical protein [Facklamia miroungae]SDG51221.1 SIR2-like domain-containing protein [Facklamia miroungae]